MGVVAIRRLHRSSPCLNLTGRRRRCTGVAKSASTHTFVPSGPAMCHTLALRTRWHSGYALAMRCRCFAWKITATPLTELLAPVHADGPLARGRDTVAHRKWPVEARRRQGRCEMRRPGHCGVHGATLHAIPTLSITVASPSSGSVCSFRTISSEERASPAGGTS